MIQIDMYMPDSCRECWFCKFDSNTGSTECVIGENILARYFESLNFEGRHEECPLIDVPDIHFGNISEFSNSSTDCISRQAAINALGEEPMVWIGSDYELAQKNQWNLDKLAIETVPSAQPERKSVIYYGDGYADGAIVYDEAECPSCGRVYDQEDFHVWGAPFCPHCGQALDWEGEKDEGN